MGLPVVLLPGVMGSRLHLLESDLFWDPDNLFRMLRWVPPPLVNPADVLARKLHRDAPAEVVTDDDSGLLPEQVELGWGGVVGSFYLPLLNALRGSAGPAVHAVGYDWRQDLVSLVPYLRDRLDAVRARWSSDRVILVTHSMGGLLARAAVKELPELAAQVAGVVHIFQPARGAVVLYRLFFTGLRVGLDCGLGGLPFDLIAGDTAAQFVTNVSGLPGPLQLLPTADYEFPAGHRWNSFSEPADLYKLYADAKSPPGVSLADASPFVQANLPQRWPEVREFHELVRGFRHPNSWSIFGTGLETDMAIGFNGPVPDEQRSDMGDGTVPAPSGGGLFDASGELDGSDLDPATFRQWQVRNVEHSRACTDSRVQGAVVRLAAQINAGAMS
jgi:pimeloyl-ACP methyl ester carboxylesterase